MKDYKYFLFNEKGYGRIYTNYRSFYNKKLRQENYSVLSKTFFKTFFLCLMLIVVSVICYGIFDVSLLMWLSVMFTVFSIASEILFIVFDSKCAKMTYISEFRLTQEFAEQINFYKVEASKRYTENLFKIIDKYNELHAKQPSEVVEVEDKKTEVVVSLNDEFIDKFIKKFQKVIEKSNAKAIEECVRATKQIKTEQLLEELQAEKLKKNSKKK